MSKHPCVICGDPNAFPLWVGGEAPDFCAYDETFGEGRHAWRGPGPCPRQRRKAEQAALMRKGCPEAFDENGNIRPGPEWLAMAIEARSNDHETLPRPNLPGCCVLAARDRRLQHW